MTARFLARHGIDGYDELVARSMAEPDWFWGDVPDFLGLPFDRRWTRVRDDGRGTPWTTWYVDGSINLSAACLDRWADDLQIGLTRLWNDDLGAHDALDVAGADELLW